MPLQRRLPKRGFVSPLAGDTAEVRLDELHKMKVDVIDLAVLKAAKVVPALTLYAKVILSGEIKRKVALKGLRVSKGARAAIEAAGGSIEDAAPAKADTAAQEVKARAKGKSKAGGAAKDKAE